MKSSELNQRRQQATPRGVGVMCNYFVEKAENATLWDVEGNEVIDFAAGIAVLNTGHRHPKIVAAVAQQLEAFTHTAYQIVPYESYVSLAERINALAPVDGPAKTAFFTTGAEAVENAVKIARAYTGRPGLITFGGGFHGRTFMTMALTGKVAPYKIGFGPFPGSVYHGVYPNAAHGITTDEAMKSLERIFKADIAPDQVAAIILEPIQGEGGFNVAPAEFMQALRTLCDTHGILLIADEVQTGFARTGKLFAHQNYGVEPDTCSMAKALGSGVPIGAVCARGDAAKTLTPGTHGSTFAGGPLACGLAEATLDTMINGGVMENAVKVGEYFRAELRKLQEKHSIITEVRGMGMINGAELANNEIGPQIVNKCFEKKVLINCTAGNVLRFIPPLIATEAEIDVVVKALDEAMTELGV